MEATTDWRIIDDTTHERLGTAPTEDEAWSYARSLYDRRGRPVRVVKPGTAAPRVLWWISWEQAGADPRPIAWPPPAAVLAFWESGHIYSGDGDEPSAVAVVALVEAEAAAHAQAIVEIAWRPGVGRWRFADARDMSKPPGDRFPPPDWSIEMMRWPWPVADEGRR